jgi:hypothetical protein
MDFIPTGLHYTYIVWINPCGEKLLYRLINKCVPVQDDIYPTAVPDGQRRYVGHDHGLAGPSRKHDAQAVQPFSVAFMQGICRLELVITEDGGLHQLAGSSKEMCCAACFT